jgi:hypothetical protein
MAILLNSVLTQVPVECDSERPTHCEREKSPVCALTATGSVSLFLIIAMDFQ